MSAFAATTTASVGAISFVPTGTATTTVEALQNKYVLIGAPSESGLGQIATEAMYHTLLANGQVERVGYLKSTLLTPIAGYMEEHGGSQVVINPAEVFLHSNGETVLVLFRSPCLPGSDMVFAHELVRFLATTLVPRATLLLTGASREGWDLNPYQPHLFSIINEHSKALVESHFPGMFTLYDGSDCVNIRLPTVSPLDALAAASSAAVDDEETQSQAISQLATSFLRQPNHDRNQSDLTFPLGMAWTVAVVYQLYFDRVVSSAAPTDLALAEQRLRETFAVYGLFDHVGSPIVGGLRWVAQLLPALGLVAATSTDDAAAVQRAIQTQLPSLWREVLSESL